MAGLQGMCCTGKVAAVGSGGANNPQTLATIISATNQRVKILGFDISFDGSTSTATPVLLLVQRTTTGSAVWTNTAVAIKPIESELSETFQTTLKTIATTEPTNSANLYTKEIPAYNGYYEVLFPFGQEILLGGGTQLSFTVTAPAAVNVSLNVRIEE